MTMPDPWDDDRLEAALHARAAAHPVPADLTVATLEAVRTGATPRRVSRSPWPLAAAAAVAVLIGGLAFAGLTSRGTSPGTATASPSVSTPPSSATPGTATPGLGDPPRQVAGLAVMAVDDAIAVRDGGKDGREIAVRGWFSSAVVPCPSLSGGPETPLRLSCEDSFKWLTADEQPVSTNDPSVPFIRPLVSLEAIDGTQPKDVILIGHFDDRRAVLCDAGARESCEDWFVVDRICWVDGSELATSDVNLLDGPRASTPDEVEAVIEAAVPGWPVLSSTTVSGAQLSTIEPTLATQDEFGLTREKAVWVVRMVVDGDPATYLIVDGTSRTYRMTATGGVESLVVDDPTAGSPTPWPPEGATMVYLSGVDVAVLDASGGLLDAREGRPDPASVGGGIAGRPARIASTTTPGQVLLTWSGSGCDRRATVTIAADLRLVSLERVEAPACEGDARAYGLLLVFDRSVDLSTLQVSASPPTKGSPNDRSATRIPVDVASEKGANASLVIVDVTGSLVDARSATPDELKAPRESGVDSPLDVVNLNGRSDTLLVRWAGSPCDLPSELRITNRTAENVAGNQVLPPTDLALLPQQTLCDGLAVGRRGVVLRFSVDVRPDAIQGRTVVGSLAR